jgi:hypothetical protein
MHRIFPSYGYDAEAFYLAPCCQTSAFMLNIQSDGDTLWSGEVVPMWMSRDKESKRIKIIMVSKQICACELAHLKNTKYT